MARWVLVVNDALSTAVARTNRRRAWGLMGIESIHPKNDHNQSVYEHETGELFQTNRYVSMCSEYILYNELYSDISNRFVDPGQIQRFHTFCIIRCAGVTPFELLSHPYSRDAFRRLLPPVVGRN